MESMWARVGIGAFIIASPLVWAAACAKAFQRELPAVMSFEGRPFLPREIRVNGQPRVLDGWQNIELKSADGDAPIVTYRYPGGPLVRLRVRIRPVPADTYKNDSLTVTPTELEGSLAADVLAPVGPDAPRRKAE